MVNLPLIEDKFALRLVGFSARDGGFIDNVLGVSPQLGTKDNADIVEEDFNDVDIAGGRIAAKWFINDAWSVNAAYLYQETESRGRNTYDPTVGDLQTVKFYEDKRDDKWQQLSLTVEGRIGSFDLVSNTGYFERETFYVDERTTYAAYFNYNFCVYAQFAGYCWSGQTFYDQDTIGFSTNDQENTRFTQEFRLTKTGDNYRFIVGAFYEEKTEDWDFLSLTPDYENTLGLYYFTGIVGYEASGGAPAWWRSADSTEWSQWAVFTNLNYDFSDQFSAEVGLRWFDQEMDRTYLVDKTFIISEFYPDVVNPTGGNEDIVPKLTLTYRIDDEKLLYALYSEGWRAGGANRNRTPFTVFPVSYEPDLLKNFEVGTKTRWLDNRLQLNATVFFGKWENYQIEAVDPSFQPCDDGEDPVADLCDQPFQVMVANVGDAEQFGVEFEMRAAPSEGLDIGLSLAYLDAKTSEVFEVTTTVPKGTRLPNVPEWKANGYAQYTWPVGSSDMYVRAQVSWQDESRNQIEDFEAEPLVSARGTYIQPAYSITDLKVGWAAESWTLEAFANNVFDERAVLYDDDLFFDPFWGGRRITTNRPLEFGVRLSYNWN
jgi:outer membrane receptor protein involved in Fe transport